MTILLRYRGKEGSTLLFSREMHESGLMEEIRKEEGNVRYEHYRSLEDPEVLLLVDSWESQEALDLHHASPIMEGSPPCERSTIWPSRRKVSSPRGRTPGTSAS